MKQEQFVAMSHSPVEKKIVTMTINGTYMESWSWLLVHQRNVPGQDKPYRIEKNDKGSMPEASPYERELIALRNALQKVHGPVVLYIKMRKGHVFSALTSGLAYKWQAAFFRDVRGYKTPYAQLWCDVMHEIMRLKNEGASFYITSVKCARTRPASLRNVA